ncbi:poly(A) RNA polymerase gld-2-like protein [Euroglyphus maynei]|uniref:Poly(A) RNA polymerase gld-2-like protein n=1 Tax=Euroglyphus maynei TaxID=6958 RepID=A0A1Y3BTJ2_EURMA|nr:poly(A) RNA polymerase gld-2-like protein [Euroglyphus maynei]
MSKIVSNYYDDLIYLVYETHRQRKEDYQAKLKIRQHFYEILNSKLDVSFDLYMVGSTQTQFSLRSSDMDLCMLVYDADGHIDQRYRQDKATTIALLKSIKDIISEKLWLKNEINLLMNARVPILKIETEHNFYRVAVDLNINGDLSIRNTFLLTYYQELDHRVAPLVVAIKSWARKNRIDSPFYGMLSSYSLSLMAIHFLQNIQPPILPLLQIDLTNQSTFDRIVNTGRLQEHLNVFILETRKKFHSQNRLPLGELFYRFIGYYLQRFSYRYHFSIRELFAYRFSSNGTFIMIEDPFHYHNTASSVTISSYMTIMEAFRRTYSSLKCYTLSEQFFDL